MRVELGSGEVIIGRAALITLPINVLNRVSFEPQLSEIKRAAATQRHAGSGVKGYVHVGGDVGNVSVFAPKPKRSIGWARITTVRKARG